VAPAAVLCAQLGAIRRPYGVFGDLERTPLPGGPPILDLRHGGGRIGRLNASVPFVRWLVFPEGLGFSLAGLCEGFVPRERIRRVERRRWHTRVHHDSPEIRSPMRLPHVAGEVLERVLADPGLRPPPGARPLPPRRGRKMGLLVFGAPVVFALGLAAVAFVLSGLEARGRDRVREFVRRAGPDAEVEVDGRPFARGAELLALLENLSSMPAHESHPGRRFPVVVRASGETLDLDLGRDSTDPTEYWVYLPENGFTDHNEIGRIRTDLLDAIPSSGHSKPRRERSAD